jgi:hypothetical protein
MVANPGDGLLAEYAGFCFIAENADKGRDQRPLSDLVTELVRTLDDASVPEVTDAARMLDDIGCDMSTKGTQRRIAKLLAPAIHKLRK